MNLAWRCFSLASRATAIVLACLSGAAHADASHDARALARVQTPPLGLPAVPIPASNPLTAEKVALGRKLYFDRRLSHNRTMSCAMCHIPEQGFTNNEVATPVGFKGRSLNSTIHSNFLHWTLFSLSIGRRWRQVIYILCAATKRLGSMSCKIEGSHRVSLR